MEPLSDQATTGGWSAIVLALAVLVSVLFGSGAAFGGVVEEPGRLVLDRVPKPELRLGGPVGERVKRNVDHWLTCGGTITSCSASCIGTSTRATSRQKR